MLLRQKLAYTFDQPSNITKVNLQLTTKTGGDLDGEGKRFNSDEDWFQAGIEELTTVTFSQENHIFLKSKGCHPIDSRNYFQILETIRVMEFRNFTVCNPVRQSFGTLLNKILQHLPKCKSLRDSKVYDSVCYLYK